MGVYINISWDKIVTTNHFNTVLTFPSWYFYKINNTDCYDCTCVVINVDKLLQKILTRGNLFLGLSHTH